MSDRGEYRPIFVALVHGPSFLALSKWARALWYPVKLQLGPLGIAAVPGAVGVFADLTGLSYSEIEDARAELVAGDWLRVEGNVWWLVRGLEFEPQLDPKNINHITFVRREWAKLPNLLLRAEFAAAYPQWLGMNQGPSNGTRGPLPGHRQALSITNPNPNPIPTPIPLPKENSSDDRARVREMFGSHQPTIDRFLGQIPSGERAAWTARLNGYLSGMGMASGQRATPEAVALAVADLDGGTVNAAKVRRFVERAMLDLANPVGRGKPSTGATVDAAFKRLEAKHAAR